MEVTAKQITTWKRALNAARITAGKEPLDKEPSEKWVRQALISEHSPIRLVEYDILIKDVPMWVTVHIVRHHIGIEKFVRTQREDRNEDIKDRDKLPQGEKNTMLICLNAQALINISKERLCCKASKETRVLWMTILSAVEKVDPIVVKYCRKKCIYRGLCPESNPCGYSESVLFNIERTKYLEL